MTRKRTQNEIEEDNKYAVQPIYFGSQFYRDKN